MRVPDAAGQGGGVEANVTENLRRRGAPPQNAPCGVPLDMWRLTVGGLSSAEELPAPKALGARWIAAQEREVAAIHQRDGAGDDAVDLLAQRRVLPFDRRNGSCRRVEQH